MRKDILGVAESLGHLSVLAFKSEVQRHRRPLSLLVHVRDQARLGVQQDFRVVLEVNLDYFVGEAEHNRMLSSHPLLHIYYIGGLALVVGRLWTCRGVSLEV